MKRYLFLVSAIFATVISVQAQRQISGYVVDAANGNALEFVPLALKQQMIGTVSNEGGKFDLLIPESAQGDTIVFSAFGYKPFKVPVAAITGPLSIRLQSSINQLKEIEVRPLPPVNYVLMALQRFKTNYPNTPYQSVAYYREKIMENKSFIQFDEGVFKTYCPNYTDTVRNQDQILLYRRADDIQDLAFMKKERERDEKRIEEGKKKKSHVHVGITDQFSGPQDILKSSKIKGG